MFSVDPWERMQQRTLCSFWPLLSNILEGAVQVGTSVAKAAAPALDAVKAAGTAVGGGIQDAADAVGGLGGGQSPAILGGGGGGPMPGVTGGGSSTAPGPSPGSVGPTMDPTGGRNAGQRPGLLQSIGDLGEKVRDQQLSGLLTGIGSPSSAGHGTVLGSGALPPMPQRTAPQPINNGGVQDMQYLAGILQRLREDQGLR